MSELVDWLNRGPGQALPSAVKAVAAHFYFISIHPFGDGNGRTARSIESYLLYQGQINVVGFYSLSNFYYRRRADYIEMLNHVRFRSSRSLMPFIQFALDGLVEELELVRQEVIRAVNQIVFRDFAREVLERKASPDTRSRLTNFLQLLGNESASVSDIRHGRHVLGGLYLSVSARTLSRDLKLLEDEGLVRREKGIIRLNLDVMNQFAR